MEPQPLSPPSVPITRPTLVRWFYVYCGVLCVIYLAVAACSLPFFLIEPSELDMGKTEAVFVGVMMLVMGLVFFVLFLMPFFLPQRPWVWVFDLVLICIGMTSACFLLACVPLLLFWLKPETKAWFGKV
jgi:predicted membrane channel-forming protein YqfA (hemolysin III family)